MLTLRGSPALSNFRLQKLLQDFAAAGLPVRAVAADFVHVAEVTADLTAAEHEVLEKVLTYGPSRASAALTGLTLVVAPRPGTLSPWSTKATDIAHLCGLAKIKRIERVIAYTFELGAALETGHRAQLAAKLHDRMTQVVFDSL